MNYSHTWFNGFDTDPPVIEVKKDDGSYVLIGYDFDSGLNTYMIASDISSDYVACVARETGLPAADLLEFSRRVETASLAHAQDQDEKGVQSLRQTMGWIK